MPLWLSWLASFLATAFNQWLANRRAEAAMRDLGASQQREASVREAERQEEIADAAAQVARDAVGEDPRDYRQE